MSTERTFKPWFLKPTARIRQVRPIRGFQLQPLESRVALSSGMQVPTGEIPASAAGDAGAFVQAPFAHDSTAQARERDTVQRLDAGSSDTASPFAVALPTGALAGTSHDAASLTAVDPGKPGSQAPSPTDQANRSSQRPQNQSDTGTDTPTPEPSEPALPATPDPRARIAQTNVAEDGFDPGLLGALAAIEDLFSGVADSGAEFEGPVNYTGSLSTTAFSALQDFGDETGVGTYQDFPAAGAWRTFHFMSHDGLDSCLGMQTLGAQNSSIVAGTMPWRRLLSGLDLPDRSALGEHQRFAELSPLEQFSPLALVATLWSRQSWAPFSSGAVGRIADRVDQNLAVAAPLSSWKVYVMRLDQASERSYRGICQGLIAGASAASSSESSSRELSSLALWPMPVVATAEAEGPAAAGGMAPLSCSERDPQSEPEPGSAVSGPVPIVTVITGSTLVAGWFWSRRASWPRRRGIQTIPRVTPLARSRAWRAPP